MWKQFHYYDWLYSAKCFDRYPAIIRPTRNSVNEGTFVTDCALINTIPCWPDDGR